MKHSTQNDLDRASPLRDVNTPEHLLDAIHRVFALTGSDQIFGARVLKLSYQVFHGKIWNANPIDLRYHDFAHTLQASYCFLDLVAGHHRVSDQKFQPRDVELGLAAILLHDSGYVMLAGDTQGTGAKYTYSHVIRSCALAASLLPQLGCLLSEIDMVIGAIRCTGITGNPASVGFQSNNEQLIGCMVTTADYLGQMAAPEYPDKLPYLFSEFSEADTFSNVPQERRAFKSVDSMLAATPGFWTHFVRPKLDKDFGGVHRFLESANKPRTNPYFSAIERNLRVIEERRGATL